MSKEGACASADSPPFEGDWDGDDEDGDDGDDRAIH